MTQTEGLPKQTNPPVLLIKPMLIGTGLGLLIILFFIFRVEGNPEWGSLWKIRPLIITPMAGAIGGLFYYFMDQLRYRNIVNPTVALVLSVVVFIIGLWMGVVVGLDGTLWD